MLCKEGLNVADCCGKECINIKANELDAFLTCQIGNKMLKKEDSGGHGILYTEAQKVNYVK